MKHDSDCERVRFNQLDCRCGHRAYFNDPLDESHEDPATEQQLPPWHA